MRRLCAITSKTFGRDCATAASIRTADLEQIATLEAHARRLIPEMEGLKREQNAAGRRGRAREAAGARRVADLCRQQGARRSRSSSSRSSSTVEQQRASLLMTLPNLPHASVPVGKSAADNRRSAPARRAARVRLRAEAALGARAGARHPRLRARDAGCPARGLRCCWAPARGWSAR